MRTISVLLALALLPAPAIAQMRNSSFELDTAVFGEPNMLGEWGPTPQPFVTAEQGIVPFEGQRMLRILTAPSGSFTAGTRGIVSLEPWAAQVASGTATVTAQARFNRVAGLPFTNSQFSIAIEAFQGDFELYTASQPNIGPSTSASTVIDDDLNTWEPIDASLTIPSAADFLTVTLVAVDLSVPATFPGHYVDDLEVTIAPWTSVGNGSLSSTGIPQLYGIGTMAPGSNVSYLVDEAPAGSIGVFSISALTPGIPILPGVELYVTAQNAFPFISDGQGQALLTVGVPLNLPSGIDVACQAGYVDASVPGGFAITEAVAAVVP